MLHIVINWLLVAGFAGADLFNAVAPATQQDSFVRWGYPRCWCRVTGLLELAAAALLAFPAGHMAALFLGAVILVAAAITVMRHREFSHLMPIGVFAVALVAAGATS